LPVVGYAAAGLSDLLGNFFLSAPEKSGGALNPSSMCDKGLCRGSLATGGAVGVLSGCGRSDRVTGSLCLGSLTAGGAVGILSACGRSD
jgi:hypothetical protein